MVRYNKRETAQFDLPFYIVHWGKHQLENDFSISKQLLCYIWILEAGVLLIVTVIISHIAKP